MRIIVLSGFVIAFGGCATTHTTPSATVTIEKDECRVNFSLSEGKNRLIVSFDRSGKEIETFDSAT